jgi:mono/diheme cytochrome c family protein
MPFGIALLLAGLFFVAGSVDSYQAQELATPTPDRLAKPTLPVTPSQADHGAQVYWLSCLPCHGEKGQGLTDEFRTTYPPEEQYCWERGCHGENPYDQGFTLPMQIPALIGPSTLAKFGDAAQLNSYIRATMPYWKPGLLTEEEAWQVTAFLLRENNLWDASTELDASNAPGVIIPRGAFLTPAVTPAQVDAGEADLGPWLWAGLGAALLLLILGAFIRLKKRTARSRAE